MVSVSHVHKEHMPEVVNVRLVQLPVNHVLIKHIVFHAILTITWNKIIASVSVR